MDRLTIISAVLVAITGLYLAFDIWRECRERK